MAKKVLRKGGTFVSVNMLTSERAEHLLQIKQMAENEEIKPFIDRKFPLNQMEAAHTYVDTGRKRGNVVITVAESGS